MTARISWRAILRDDSGSSAVEFALVSLPFFLVILMILQMGMYYMAQSALDSGVVKEADALVNTFYASSNSNTTPVAPSLSTLTNDLANKAGGMINSGTLSVDLVPFSALSSGPVVFGSTGAPSIGSPNSVLALRAQAPVPGFLPGFTNLMVRSTTLIRRQNS